MESPPAAFNQGDQSAMKLEGRIFRANLMLREFTVEQADTGEKFVPQLERCLIELCHSLEIPIPLWLTKNTREFARFHQTIFFAESFGDPIKFDRFQINWHG
jgi:hypothetical protein